MRISSQFYFKGISEHLLLLLQVAIHFEGKFYEFVPWEGKVEWEIAPWGSWKMTAQTKTHEVIMCGLISFVNHRLHHIQSLSR